METTDATDTPEQKRLASASTLAQEYGLSARTLVDRASSGAIPAGVAVRLGKRTLFDRARFAAWIGAGADARAVTTRAEVLKVRQLKGGVTEIVVRIPDPTGEIAKTAPGTRVSFPLATVPQ